MRVGLVISMLFCGWLRGGRIFKSFDVIVRWSGCVYF